MNQTDLNEVYNAVLSLPDDQFASWVADLDSRIARVQAGIQFPVAKPHTVAHTQQLLKGLREERDSITYVRKKMGQVLPQEIAYVDGYFRNVRPMNRGPEYDESDVVREEREALERRGKDKIKDPFDD